MSTTSSIRVAFIGGGQMATALVGGLLRRGWPPALIAVADPDAAARRRLAAECPGIDIHDDNAAAVAGAGVWVLAVKPQRTAGVAMALAPRATAQRPLLLSVAAGIRLAELTHWLGGAERLVRCMPNRPALIGAGITGLFAAPGLADDDRRLAEQVLGAVGSCVWLEEEADMDAVTAVSGSGPAYLFLLLELLEEAARREGLPADTARRLAVETLAGAARMARETGIAPAALRESVTSPGGTTAAALAVLGQGAWCERFLDAVHAARVRSAELADSPVGAP